MFNEKSFKKNLWDFDKFKSELALKDENGVGLTFDELKNISDSVAKSISERCLAFILCQNSLGSVIGYVGFTNNGIVPLMLNANLDQSLLKKLLDAYKPAYLWLPKEKTSEFPFPVVFEAYDYVLLKTDEAIYSMYDELALLLSTSGSTGSPKFVRLSYENLRTNTAQIVEYLKLKNSKSVAITSLPMNYTYGLSVINTHLAAGRPVLLSDKSIMQKEFWEFFRKDEATFFSGVPYTYEILDKLRFSRMKLPSLKVMTQAGGKLPPELHEKFALAAKEKNVEFVVMYGSCEATARMGYLPPKFAIDKKGAMGVAIPNGKFSIIDDMKNQITTPKTRGELVYEGKNVALGYAMEKGDLEKGDEWGGKLFTGDIAEFDEDGVYYIVGRKKRFLKIYGNRLSLDGVEELIVDEFQTEAVSAGYDDNVYIFIMDESIKPQVHKFIAEKTKLNPSAFKVVVLEKIPKNDAGKVLYKELDGYIENA